MTKAALLEELSAVSRGGVRTDEPMRDHTTFRIGGPADFFVTPHSAKEIARVIRLCDEAGIPWFIMGNGSNLLVSDSGFRGVVIRLGREFSAVSSEGTTLYAEAGALLSQISAAAAERALTGLEFAGGIPGTLGGACVMNAGAYGGEMKQVLRKVTALDGAGAIHTLSGDELKLGYRTSVFQTNAMIVLSAEMELREGEPSAISETMRELRRLRQEKQPLELPSAGSTFKRPAGNYAGKLIMEAGLRGYAVGGAQVSVKHCGFVVNAGGATAGDVRRLIDDVSERVFEVSGVRIQPEVRFLGEF